jgi:hypothetical protein
VPVSADWAELFPAGILVITGVDAVVFKAGVHPAASIRINAREENSLIDFTLTSKSYYIYLLYLQYDIIH